MLTPMDRRKTGLWIVTGLVALTFLATGAGKLAAIPPSPENFTRWNLSMNFMRLVGAAEIAGGLGLLVPRLAPLAALGLGAILVGALRTGIVFHETLHVLLPSVLLVLLAIIAWGRSTKPAR